MARGDAARKAANRRAHQAEARIAQLWAEVENETAMLAEAERAAAEVDDLGRYLEQLNASRADDLAEDLDRLRTDRDFLQAAVRDLTVLNREIERARGTMVDKAANALGGGIEGLERYMALTRHEVHVSGNHATDTVAGQRIARARGERRTVVDERTGTFSWADALGGLVRPEVTAKVNGVLPLGKDGLLDETVLTPEQREVFDWSEKIAQGLLASRQSTLTLDAIHTWHPLPYLEPWLSKDADPVAQSIQADLGVVPELFDAPPPAAHAHAADTDGGAPAWPAPLASMPATTRDKVAAAAPGDVVERWQDRLVFGEALCKVLGAHASMFSAGPRLPRPGRAAVLRHQYAKSSLGLWSRIHEDAVWHDGQRSGVWGQVAAGLMAASSFWLPAGQTDAFASSEPLDAPEAADLLLPFPQVFLAFAEPLVINPRREPTTEETRGLINLEAALSFLLDADPDPTMYKLIEETDDYGLFGLFTVDDVLSFHGARIEGLLLLSDSLGRVGDTFAWCVRVPGRRHGSLGRFVIPASMSAAGYRTVVENLIAVVAWADWHEPDIETAVPPGTRLSDVVDLMDTPAFKRDADRVGAGNVHVLNVRSTLRRGSSSAAPTGRQLAPHVRRGHWRRQRYGPGRSQVRRVRIAPVAVNASRGTVAPRVYVLPGDASQ